MSEDFDLVLGLDAITDLGIIINGENKTLEWNGNTLPLEEINDKTIECNYDNIGRPVLCFTDKISNELKSEYLYNAESKM